ncbi:MAG: DUF4922 domain-containing protein [Rhodospirillales bacterium]|nr:MAG: DUF4922 domain-containing protein [Rhodospirillales bacterium]
MSEYDTAWHELNARLRTIEVGGGGLHGALTALKRHQQRTGFIKDALDDVERYTLYHPQDSSRFFRAQYNPKRALRFNGNGIAPAPVGFMVHNEGCFLCRDNIRWQQRGVQMGYEVRVGETGYYAWMNPFPLLPTHIVVATQAHASQEWGFELEAPDGAASFLVDLVALAAQMPGYVGFYNGVGAGASIPGHLHFHFCQRPQDDPEFPLERAGGAFEEPGEGAGILTRYPVAVAIWRGSPKQVVAAVSAWMARWRHRNRMRLDNLTGNFIVSMDGPGDRISLYFIPRDRGNAIGRGMQGLVGGLELLGEVVFSDPKDQELLENGAIDYFALEGYLARVHTPMFPS